MFTSFFNMLGLTVTRGIQTGMVSHGGGAISRTPVNFDSAMQVSAFWACARLIVETIAAMPIRCRSRNGDGWEENIYYDLWRLINYSPNRYQTRIEFLEALMLNLVTDGNFYAVVERNARGRIIGLLPLMSSQMTVELQEDGTKLYTYRTANGDVNVYAEQSIWHVFLFGNGIVGLSPVSHMAKTLGITIDANHRAARVAASGGKVGGILTIDKVLTKEQREKVRENWKGLSEGQGDKLYILEADMKFQQTTLGPLDMQLLETRDFQIGDIARFMGVPSVLINHNSGQTAWGSGIQQIIQGFYKFGLRPYLTRLEASIQRHLIPRKDWDEIKISFDFDDLLAADLATRLEAFGKAINSGQMTPNEARAEESRPSKKGGDKIYLNGTLVPAGTTARPVQPGGDNGKTI